MSEAVCFYILSVSAFLFLQTVSNSYSHLILLVDPPSGRSEKDEVIHNNYAAVPIVVAANVSSKQNIPHISALFLYTCVYFCRLIVITVIGSVRNHHFIMYA